MDKMRAVKAVCFSPDGSVVVAACDDNDHMLMAFSVDGGLIDQVEGWGGGLRDACLAPLHLCPRARVERLSAQRWRVGWAPPFTPRIAPPAQVKTGPSRVMALAWAEDGALVSAGAKHFCVWPGSAGGGRPLSGAKAQKGLWGKAERTTLSCVAFAGGRADRCFTGSGSGGLYRWSGRQCAGVVAAHAGGPCFALAGLPGALAAGLGASGAVLASGGGAGWGGCGLG